MRSLSIFILAIVFTSTIALAQKPHKVISFDNDWRFMPGENKQAKNAEFDDSNWRKLNLPHDWSIEGCFNEKHPTTQVEGSLPAGIGWYRKTFLVPNSSKDKNVFIDFDGVYRNSEVWINGHYLGKRPSGYISFSYNLTPYLKFAAQNNVIAVKVDNSGQPNSRWYTGSGINRNVWLRTVNKTHFFRWGTFVVTPQITTTSATVHISASIVQGVGNLKLKTVIVDEQGKSVASCLSPVKNAMDTTMTFAEQSLVIKNPVLWSPSRPYLYKVILQLIHKGKVLDNYAVITGLRSFNFDSKSGFSLNGIQMKIKGVCMHENLGALGSAVNTSAIARQLKLLKDMGCNAIRTAHNPPAPEFLDLCDQMGFLVMDEAFDMWGKKKSAHDYHDNWAEWYKRDLTDQVLRDRNHPSVFMWSIGNEIREQFDTTGTSIAQQLASIVKSIDNTRPLTSALSEPDLRKNFIYKSGALDVVGLNYHQELYPDFLKNYPGQKFVATETMSALETRGFYDQPTDSTRYWPKSSKIPFKDGNADLAVTAYDNVAAYWGSTHEQTWKIIKKYDFLSGLFVWTGFDYIGEPTPYPWPARSSYFGIIDLAGFPKDVYYMYQSEWTNKPVLHLLPHWNWKPEQLVEVWAYYSQADEVELFLNGKSLGIRTKQGDDLHVSWQVKFEPGVLRIISRKAGKVVLTEEEYTAGPAAKIILSADRGSIKADGKDLSFITVKIVDKNGIIVPGAENQINFSVTGPAHIGGVDNGSQISLESFKADHRKAFHGLCLAIIQSDNKAGIICITAKSAGLEPVRLKLKTIM